MIGILSNIHDAEAPYLEAFIRYHNGLGIEEFVFATSEGCRHHRVKSILNRLSIPLAIVPHRIPMRQVRDWCLQQVKIQSSHVAIIDIDEFLLGEHIVFCDATGTDHASFPWLCNVDLNTRRSAAKKSSGTLIARGKTIVNHRKAVHIDFHQSTMQPGASFNRLSKASQTPIQHFYARSCSDLILKDLYTRGTPADFAPNHFADYAFTYALFEDIHPGRLTGRLAACALIHSLQSTNTNQRKPMEVVGQLEDSDIIGEILDENNISQQHVEQLSRNISALSLQITNWQREFLSEALADIPYFAESQPSAKHGAFLDQFTIKGAGINIRSCAAELFKRNHYYAEASKRTASPDNHAAKQLLLHASPTNNQDTRPEWIRVKSWNKCFGLGFNKTGTTSLDEAMKNLGLRSDQTGVEARATEGVIRGDYTHFVQAMQDLDFHQDLPISQGYHFAALDALFPGSRFILTRRDSEEWANSFIAYYALELQSISHHREPRQRPYIRSGYAQNWLSYHILMSDVTQDGRDPAHMPLQQERVANAILTPWFRDRLIRIYESRNCAIRSYFAGRQNDFAEVDVSSESCLATLCQLLGAPTVEGPMPHLHSRRSHLRSSG